MTIHGLPIEPVVHGDVDGPLELSTRIREDGTVVVCAVGEVDTSTAGRLRSVLDAELERQPPELVIDLSGVRYLGSAGLAVLVATQEVADRRGVGLRLIATTRAVNRALQITGLIDLFTVSGDGR